uniref:F-box domain-containing protein n=1 Tax=Caenorhabditis tropicalis TaxID=1561998 RepID=A0A1I7UTY0_9PELO
MTTTMTTFPLFHLPLVAMEHVLSMMNPYELMDLTKTSSSAKRAVKNFRRTKPKFRVTLVISTEPRIYIFGNKESWIYSWTTEAAGAQQSTFDNTFSIENYNFIFSNDPIEEFMRVYESIREVLKCRDPSVAFKLDSYPCQNKMITDWIRSQHDSIASIEVRNDGRGFFDDLKYFFNNITVTECVLLIVSGYEDDFQLEFPTSPSLYIEDARFIGYEQLLRMKNPRIFLHRHSLTDQETNGFLKSWMACESHLELEYFNINVSGPEAMEVIMDLPHEETPDSKAIKKEFSHPKVKNGFDIRRCDGKVATVCYGNYIDKHRFFMITH